MRALYCALNCRRVGRAATSGSGSSDRAGSHALRFELPARRAVKSFDNWSITDRHPSALDTKPAAGRCLAHVGKEGLATPAVYNVRGDLDVDGDVDPTDRDTLFGCHDSGVIVSARGAIS